MVNCTIFQKAILSQYYCERCDPDFDSKSRDYISFLENLSVTIKQVFTVQTSYLEKIAFDVEIADEMVQP